jgi:hypothetical protein
VKIDLFKSRSRFSSLFIISLVIFILTFPYNHMRPKSLLLFTMGILLSLSPGIYSQVATLEQTPDKLVVVWTSDDPYVAERVALMYTHAAKTNFWFMDVTLIIWGPSAKLISENIKLQEKL